MQSSNKKKPQPIQNEHHLTAIVEQSPDNIVILDNDLNILYANRSKEIMRLNVLNNVLKYVHPDYAEAYEQTARLVFKTGQLHQLIIPAILPDGTTRWYLNRMSLLRDGNITLMLVIATDITDMKALEQQNQLNYERLLEAQETAHIGSWDWNVETDEIYWSPELYRLFGLDPESGKITYEIWQSLLDPEEKDGVMGTLKQGLKNAQPGEVEFKVKHPDGKTVWLRSKGIVTRNNKDGRTRRINGTIEDITEKRKAEEQRKAYVKSLEEMLFITSHRIRKPVSSSLGLISLINTKSMSKEDFEKYIKYFNDIALELDSCTREMTEFLHANAINVLDKPGPRQ